MNNKLKIYVASSWRNPYYNETVQILKECGHEVYDFINPREGNNGFSWSEIDENWQQWTPEEYKKALENQIAVDGFSLDFNAMMWANVCVMVLPCGRSAHTEAGFMKGIGKSVYVFQPIHQEPELMYKIYDGIITSPEKLRLTFSKPSFSFPISNNINFQNRVDNWLHACFGEQIARDKTERNHRFLEEALELTQALGCTKSEAHQLVDYVFGRPVGEHTQECGGVMVTLAALCLANMMDMNTCGETELKRIWDKVAAIRDKQAKKPKHSPLPQ
jgi:hypothetical protein